MRDCTPLSWLELSDWREPRWNDVKSPPPLARQAGNYTDPSQVFPTTGGQARQERELTPHTTEMFPSVAGGSRGNTQTQLTICSPHNLVQKVKSSLLAGLVLKYLNQPESRPAVLVSITRSVVTLHLPLLLSRQTTRNVIPTSWRVIRSYGAYGEIVLDRMMVGVLWPGLGWSGLQ